MSLSVVRVIIGPEEKPLNQGPLESFIACLRSAGVLKVHRDDDEGLCFDVYPPRTTESAAQSQTWARQTAERMQSFGFNAVKAPEFAG